MNTKLPFFSYGIFRPGEIPFNGIKNFIDKVEKLTIKGHIQIRDGVYLFSEKFESNVKGILIGSDFDKKFDYSLKGIQNDGIYSLISKYKHPFNDKNKPK